MFLFLDYYLENLGYILIDHRSNIDFFCCFDYSFMDYSFMDYLFMDYSFMDYSFMDYYYLMDTLERFTRHPATLFNIINTMRPELSYQ